MNNGFMTITVLAMFFFANGQKGYQRGYYNDGSGKHETMIKVVCLDDANKPESQLETIASDGAKEKIPFARISEVGIGSDIKMVKFVVQLDDSDLYKIQTYEKRFIFERREVFLNVLIEGTLSLYVFESSVGPKYFYTKDGERTPQQLEYKKYLSPKSGQPVENANFRLQMQQEMSCPGDPFVKFSTLTYTRKSLENVVTAYNACSQGSVKSVYQNNMRSKPVFRFGIFGGYSEGSANVTEVQNPPPSLKGGGVVGGGEAELLTSRHKVGFFARFSISKMKLDREFDFDPIPTDGYTSHETYKMDISAVDISLGVRYHFNFESMHEFFLEASMGKYLPSGSLERSGYTTNGTTLHNEYAYRSPSPTDSGKLGAGVGYVFSRHYGLYLTYDGLMKPFENALIKIQTTALSGRIAYFF